MSRRKLGISEVVSHSKMCEIEGGMLQRGMNYRFHNGVTVVLMSKATNAPYNDAVMDDGKVLIYEGHDVPKIGKTNPKNLDQQLRTSTGTLTENGKFFEAVEGYKDGKRNAELVKVYEKMKKGIWVYNGVFELVDAWAETSKSEGRIVYKFKLLLTEKSINRSRRVKEHEFDLTHNRLIPPSVKRNVWARDKGKCVKCGSTTNLHFDHILPFSKGGTSLKEENIQLLCARHNLEKRDKIE